MPKQNKAQRAAAAAAEETAIRGDIDQALAIAQENDLFRFARNESGIVSALMSILRGNAIGRGGVHLPNEKQFKNWLSAEDAMYVIDYAKKKGWLNDVVGAIHEGGSIRLTTTQLRRVIRESVARRIELLEEAELEQADMTDSAEFISGALVDWLDTEGKDLIASNAWEVMIGTVGEEGVSVPGRVEDVDHFAEQIASKVVSDPALKDAISKIAKTILETSMDSAGSPGPGGF